jgi:uncharacterized protein (DUF58 family)
MLTPDLIRKIKKIHIKTSRQVNTMMAGQYKSAFRGSGIEFEEVREYSPGDEVKDIDWKVSARLGRPFVKKFREERELIVMLLVDMSASKIFGTQDMVKRETSAELAAILAFNAIRNNDKVGAILFTDHVEKYIPPQKGSSHVWRVIREIFAFEPVGKKTDIESALRYLGHVCSKRTVSFLASDFLCHGYLQQLKIAARKHDFIGIVLSDPGEFILPDGGILQARDLETGELFYLDAADRKTRNAYTRYRKKQYEKTLRQLKSADVDTIEVSTAADPADALVRFFRLREKRIR